MASPLLREFLAALPAAKRAADPGQMERCLREALERAQAAWPGIEVPAGTYARALARRVESAEDLAQALERLHHEDLYLACGCALGLTAALRAFDQRCLAPLVAEAHRMGLSSSADEVAQLLRATFFAGRAGHAPAIDQYSAAGALAQWVRVSGMRELLKARKRSRREQSLGDAELPDALGAPEDPELAHMKEGYRREFGFAFREAVGRLEARERTLLRQHFLDGLTVEELGLLHRVHKSTVSRWLTRIRAEVLEKTRESLRTRLDVRGDELDSIMRLVRSRLDVSFRALFESRRP